MAAMRRPFPGAASKEKDEQTEEVEHVEEIEIEVAKAK